MWIIGAQISSECAHGTLLELSQRGAEMPGYLLTDSSSLLMTLYAPGGMKFLFPGYPSLKLRKTPTSLKKSLEKEAER